MRQVVELEIPARPEFVGIARMAVAAVAGIRPGLAYERVDDLRIVVSEACTRAIERLAGNGGAQLRVLCVDDTEALEVFIEAPGAVFDSALAGREESDDQFRISLIRALVDESEVGAGGNSLRLVLRRSPDVQTMGQG